MTNLERSKMIGKHESYFGSIRCNSPKLYKVYEFFGKGDVAKGYIEFQNYCVLLRRYIIEELDRVSDDRSESVWELREHNTLEYDASAWLYGKGLYGSRATAYEFVTVYLYTDCRTSYPFYKKLRKMVKLYKKEQKCQMKS